MPMMMHDPMPMMMLADDASSVIARNPVSIIICYLTTKSLKKRFKYPYSKVCLV